MEVLIADELDIRLTVQMATISVGCCGGFHGEYAALWGGVSWVDRKGGKKEVERCVRTEIYKVLWDFFFHQKPRTTRTTSFPYDHALVCSLVKCFLNRKGDNSIIFSTSSHKPKKTCCRYSLGSIHSFSYHHHHYSFPGYPSTQHSIPQQWKPSSLILRPFNQSPSETHRLHEH